jgi:hypothetical protein
MISVKRPFGRTRICAGLASASRMAKACAIVAGAGAWLRACHHAVAFSRAQPACSKQIHSL